MTKVIAFGSFDPLHKGHIDYFKQAKKLGDELVVVVASDEKILINKDRTARQSQKGRVEKIEKLGIVDEVVVGEPAGKYELINTIKPDIIALGYDQIIPAPLKSKLKQCKIITLKPYKAEIYKSSIVGKVHQVES